MKPKILLIFNHPAVYTDVLLIGLQTSFDVSVLYGKRKSSEKLWQNHHFFPGRYLPDVGYGGLIRLARSSDFVLIGGWHGRHNLFAISFCLVYHKLFAVYTDVPEPPITKGIRFRMKRYLLSVLPYIFVTGPTCAAHFVQHYGIDRRKMYDFPYCVTLPQKKSLETLDATKILDNGQDVKPLRVFIANRFIPRKGYSVVLRALKILAKRRLIDRFQFVIAGSGPEFAKYEQQFSNIKGDIKFLGWISANDYYCQMWKCDVYVHASIFEPYGIPVLDALAHGKVVVASRGVMSAIDLIENGKNGYLYDAGDPEQLAGLLEEVLLDTTEAGKIRAQAFETTKKFEVSNHVAVVQKVLSLASPKA